MGKEASKADEPIRFRHEIQQIQDAIAALDQAFDPVDVGRLRLGRQSLEADPRWVAGVGVHVRVPGQIAVELVSACRKLVAQGVRAVTSMGCLSVW